MSIEVEVKKGEPVDKALRRLKRKMEGVLQDVRRKRYFRKRSEKKRLKNKELAFNNMLKVRREKQ